jgi:hypothetical protein
MLNFICKRVFAVNTSNIATTHFSQMNFETDEKTSGLPIPTALRIGHLGLITWEPIDRILKALQAFKGMSFKVP